VGDEDLRDLFAFGAMISKTWMSGKEDIDARKCYAIADAMIEAKYAEPEPEEGITAIKPKRKPRSTT
jgi:hypothetical protein